MKKLNPVFVFYFISDVAQPGFCTQFCGWHTYYGSYKYSLLNTPLPMAMLQLTLLSVSLLMS